MEGTEQAGYCTRRVDSVVTERSCVAHSERRIGGEKVYAGGLQAAEAGITTPEAWHIS